MYRWVRTAKISNGRFPQALGWAKEIAGFAKKYDAPEIKFYVNAFGETGTVSWVAEYESLDAYEKVQNLVLADPEYWQMIAKASEQELFIDGEVNDSLWKEL